MLNHSNGGKNMNNEKIYTTSTGNTPAIDNEILYPITNDIVFGLVMQDLNVCKELIQRILPGRRIKEAHLCDGAGVQIQKVIHTGILEKGVRLDVLFEGDSLWYDVELQNVDGTALPKRGRYYGSAMDIDEIAKGSSYEDLKTSYVIFICTFDHYKKGKAVYSFQNYDVKNALPYGDESYKIIVNTECPPAAVPEELRSLFHYFKDEEVPEDDEFIKKLDELVRKYNSAEWRGQIMTLEEKMRMGREEALAEGLKQGIEQGICSLIETCQELCITREETMEKAEQKFSLLKAEAEAYMQKYWK